MFHFRDVSGSKTFNFLSLVADGFDLDVDRKEKDEGNAEKVLLECIKDTETGKLAYSVFKTAKTRQVDLDLTMLPV